MAANFGHQFANNIYISKLSANNLTSIISPDAFRNCCNLREAYFLELIDIQSVNGFYDCSELQHVELPKLQSINNSEGLFKGNTNLINLDFQALTSIGNSDNVFRKCTSLLSVNFPSLLELSQNTGMFLSCSSLSSIEFPVLSSLDTSTVECMFKDCTNLKILKMPAISSTEFPKYWKDTFKGC